MVQAFAAFDRCIARFMDGNSEADDKRRHNTFKLIPKVTKGSWVIRNAVGSTPVLLGKKLTTKYFRSSAALHCTPAFMATNTSLLCISMSMQSSTVRTR